MVAVTTTPASAPTRPPGAVLEAVLERLTYVNEDTGYTVAKVATSRGGDDLLTVVGRCWARSPGKACACTVGGPRTRSSGASSWSLRGRTTERARRSSADFAHLPPRVATASIAVLAERRPVSEL